MLKRKNKEFTIIGFVFWSYTIISKTNYSPNNVHQRTSTAATYQAMKGGGGVSCGGGWEEKSIFCNEMKDIKRKWQVKRLLFPRGSPPKQKRDLALYVAGINWDYSRAETDKFVDVLIPLYSTNVIVSIIQSPDWRILYVAKSARAVFDFGSCFLRGLLLLVLAWAQLFLT